MSLGEKCIWKHITGIRRITVKWRTTGHLKIIDNNFNPDVRYVEIKTLIKYIDHKSIDLR